MSDIQKAPVVTNEEAKVAATATGKVIEKTANELTNDDLDNVSGGKKM